MLIAKRQLSVCCVFRCLVINCIELVSLFIGLNRDLLVFSTHCAPCSINTSASPFFPLSLQWMDVQFPFRRADLPQSPGGCNPPLCVIHAACDTTSRH